MYLRVGVHDTLSMSYEIPEKIHHIDLQDY